LPDLWNQQVAGERDCKILIAKILFGKSFESRFWGGLGGVRLGCACFFRPVINGQFSVMSSISIVEN
jgi:hypothetical protein